MSLPNSAPHVGTVNYDQAQVPGTVYLIDLDGHLNACHESRRSDIVLVPTPSSDPDDPLNWSPVRKRVGLLCSITYCTTVGICSAALYSVLGDISANSDLSLADLNAGTGYMFLFAGIGCLAFQPLALQFGKRPVYLMSLLGNLGMMLWAPYTTSKGEWFASKILQGLFSAPLESLCEITIADLYFVHERGFYMSFYALALSGSSMSAPIFAGLIAAGQSWKWVFFWCAILCAVTIVVLFFFLEETNYKRSNVPVVLGGVNNPISLEATLSGDRKPDTGTVQSNMNPGIESKGTQVTYLKQRSFLDKLKLFDRARMGSNGAFLPMLWLPFKCMRLPLIVFCGFYYGSSLVWYSVLNGTAALILEGQYGFSTTAIGASFVAPLLGVFAGSAYTAYFGNPWTLHQARKNNGILEAEHRLWLLTPPIMLLPLGLVLWGVGAAQKVHWFGVLFAMFIVSGTSALSVQGSTTYCIESYHLISGQAMVSIMLIRNTMSFAVNYGLTTWVTNMGLQNAFILAAVAGAFQTASVLPVIKWGKVLRKRSVSTYFKYANL
ncbi:uncharacterized protein CCOS01_15423 [Colletotrichum costaricense]|uniref:Major facilitator superfamily (MFS) profile domain-containing protein n=1 Tax=Colletotrichum costaricense TaxID=1209916 RepID=A0AAJ0DTH8_9PEZI|nr:uncharacterized protein CCOS01_15423 [Colletotrichum costaricense]KAK1509329.1 hypothetical protein CCOS01_15423 [Colletotrichum costaricense]